MEGDALGEHGAECGGVGRHGVLQFLLETKELVASVRVEVAATLEFRTEIFGQLGTLLLGGAEDDGGVRTEPADGHRRRRSFGVVKKIIAVIVIVSLLLLLIKSACGINRWSWSSIFVIYGSSSWIIIVVATAGDDC